MLNKERILERTNRRLDIFNHFIPIHFRPGKNFLNPSYDDRNASCNIYLDKKNHIYRMKDFWNDDYTCDPFDLVGKIYGLNCNVPSNFIKRMFSICIFELHRRLFLLLKMNLMM